MKNIFQIFQFLENRDPIPLYTDKNFKTAEAFLISVEAKKGKRTLSNRDKILPIIIFAICRYYIIIRISRTILVFH